ncbi:hypothetical protein KX816_19875 [Sphingosinicellaceae bacterium]|nr:hypothetical protein KX816_19875 [Sphingosinicellaceae bacterium]
MVAQSELWKRLAEHLGIVAVAPVELEIKGQRLSFAALLPQFGGRAGLVADPSWEVIEPHVEWLVGAGLAYSAVTLDDTVDDESARDMLRDWAWTGDGAAPDWF